MIMVMMMIMMMMMMMMMIGLDGVHVAPHDQQLGHR